MPNKPKDESIADAAFALVVTALSKYQEASEAILSLEASEALGQLVADHASRYWANQLSDSEIARRFREAFDATAAAISQNDCCREKAYEDELERANDRS